MRKVLWAGVCLLVSGGLCFGGEFKIGGHGSYSTGGDIENEDYGYGGQIGVVVNPNVSLELSGTAFEEKDENSVNPGIDIITFALTLRLGTELSEGVTIYGGGGGNYSKFDIDEADVDFDNEIGYHFCGGLELTISDKLELFGEYRMSKVTLKDDDIDEDFDFGLIRAGLNLKL